MRPLLCTAIALAALGAPASAQGATEWRTLADATAPDSALSFSPMPPGWHVTNNGPGALIYKRDEKLSGIFAVEMEVFLFPGTSNEGYGFALGFEDSPTGPGYLAFLLRGDGSAAIAHQLVSVTEGVPANGELRWPVPWSASPAVVPRAAGDEPVKNVLRLQAGARELVLTANGTRVAAIPRTALPDGAMVAMRAGAGLNLHVSRLDLIRPLAPGR